MLKRDGLYFFLYKENNEKLYYLEEGHKRKLKCQNVEYYYHAMPIYQNEMKNIMKNYYKSLKFLAEQIKKVGGNGRIHGCIIDINCYNHIFLEPSGEIRAYWAESICSPKEYSSIEMLLKIKREDLYCKFLESKNELQIFSQNKLLIQGEQDAVEVINDTRMYARSNLLKKYSICLM